MERSLGDSYGIAEYDSISCEETIYCISIFISGGSKGGVRGTRPPPGAQILSIACSFWENLAKSYVGAPPGELAPPPRGNPGSATVYV